MSSKKEDFRRWQVPLLFGLLHRLTLRNNKIDYKVFPATVVTQA